jgi:aspartate racemase
MWIGKLHAHWLDRWDWTGGDGVLLPALVKPYAQAGRRLELTIANADARELVKHLEARESTAQAAIFAGYIDQLKAGGCAAVALTSMGSHFCIKDLALISSLPLISGLTALDEYLSITGVERVGVLVRALSWSLACTASRPSR